MITSLDILSDRIHWYCDIFLQLTSHKTYICTSSSQHKILTMSTYVIDVGLYTGPIAHGYRHRTRGKFLFTILSCI